MSSELVIDVKADEIVIALLREKKLIELTKEKTSMQFAVGDIYLGKVKKIMPGLNAAFVNVGYEKDAFLHYLDLSPQFHSLDSYIKQCIARKGMPVSKLKLEPEIPKNGKIADILPRSTCRPRVWCATCRGGFRHARSCRRCGSPSRSAWQARLSPA